MYLYRHKVKRNFLFVSVMLMLHLHSFSQTDMDGILMNKNYLCSGFTYEYSGWTNYWEGTEKRINQNLGNVTATAYAVMTNYGVTDRLNIIAGLPYIQTKASAGQMHAMNGIQDITLSVKYALLQKHLQKGLLSVMLIGGYSTPVTNYPSDFLPLSIGSGSTKLLGRIIGDYQLKNWFTTISATYICQNNIRIDRPAYYTTTMHYSNEVQMPDAVQYNLRAGLRSDKWIVEIVGNNQTTLGGFDISKNNMPFPSNRMNSTTLGLHFKYVTAFLPELSFIGSSDYTIAGRNVGQATYYSTGVFYAFTFKQARKASPSKTT